MEQFTGLSIIIPTVDETESIAKTIDEIAGSCVPGDIREILIVYAGISSVEHIRAMQSLVPRYPELHVSVLPQPGKGLGDALYFGCTAASGSHFLMLGADRENDTSVIPEFISLASSHPDTVITSSRKKTKDGMREYSALKHLLSNIFDILMKIFFSSRQTDVTYAYQITPKRYFDEYRFMEDHNAFVLELALMTDIMKLPFIEVPTRISRRTEGVSHSGASYYLRFIPAAIKLFINRKAGHIK